MPTIPRVFVEAYGAAAVIIVAAVLIGRAICLGGGRRETWGAAPAVGLAALIVLEAVTIKLPGRAVTATVIAVLALIAAAVVLRRANPTAWFRQRAWLESSVVVGVAILAASVPFFANGRVGLNGVNLDNDTASHLLWAEGLRSARMAHLYPPAPGYPLGPHSLVATVGTVIGAPLDMAFTGLFLAIVGVTALVGAAVLAGESLWRRTVIGVLCSLAYLVASYYAEGAFKETAMALLLLGFVVQLDQASTRWSGALWLKRWWMVAPAVVLAVAAMYTYSYIGLLWFGASLGVWLVASVVRRPQATIGWLRAQRWRGEVRWALGALALTVLLLLPAVGGVLSFFRGYGLSPASTGAITLSNTGNLYHPLSPYEAFGLWNSPDFRVYPSGAFHAGELSVLAVGVAVYGGFWWWRRGRLLLPAAVGACLLIWWWTNRTQSAYVSAKALAISAPVIMALSLSGLLARRPGPRSSARLRLLAAAVFCVFAAYWSYQELRHQPVQAPESVHELMAFGQQIGHHRVLFLGIDEFGSWDLRPAAVTGLFPAELSAGTASTRPSKRFDVGNALDFDSVAPTDLDKFGYVVTSTTPYASQPPPNFVLVSRRRLWELWRRTGPTTPRSVIETAGYPGAVLNCSSPAGRRLRSEHGEAGVLASPVVFSGATPMAVGDAVPIKLPLPSGQWDLSLQYVSAFDFEVDGPGHRWLMPAYLGRQGPFFRLGSVTGHGPASPLTLTVRPIRPSAITGELDNLFTYPAMIAATRRPVTRQIVPLSQACGKYVDWFRLT